MQLSLHPGPAPRLPPGYQSQERGEEREKREEREEWAAFIGVKSDVSAEHCTLSFPGSQCSVITLGAQSVTLSRLSVSQFRTPGHRDTHNIYITSV